jgi:hypothetical protein
MGAPGLGHGPEAGQAVADDRAGRIEATFGKNRNRVITEAGDPPQLQLHRLALRRGFDGGDERRLTRGTSAALAAGALSAEVDVVQFNSPTQLLGGVTFHHHLSQLMLDLPGGGLGHAEATAQLDAGDALLALGQVIHGAEPQPQRHMGRGEDRARDWRGLVAAGVALKQPAGPYLAIRPPAAGRAFEAIRPAGCDHDRAAFLLATVKRIEPGLTETLLELHLVPSRCRAPLISYVHDLYHVREAEESP